MFICSLINYLALFELRVGLLGKCEKNVKIRIILDSQTPYSIGGLKFPTRNSGGVNIFLHEILG